MERGPPSVDPSPKKVGSHHTQPLSMDLLLLGWGLRKKGRGLVGCWQEREWVSRPKIGVLGVLTPRINVVAIDLVTKSFIPGSWAHTGVMGKSTIHLSYTG